MPGRWSALRRATQRSGSRCLAVARIVAVVLCLLVATASPWPASGALPLAAARPMVSKLAREARPRAQQSLRQRQRTSRRMSQQPKRPTVLPGRVLRPVVTLRNLWTREILPVGPGEKPPSAIAVRWLRCHFTNQWTAMDSRLMEAILRAARRFRSPVVELISGYRAPKYNLMLRKKGRQVAGESQHSLGQAVDFRLPDVPTRKLLRFIDGLRLGGVGYYPESRFVHVDVGRVRRWRGR